MASAWISMKDAMEMLGVGATTIKRWADDGRLPHIRTAGGHRRFERAAVQRYLRASTGSLGRGSSARRMARQLKTGNVEMVRRGIEDAYADFGNWFRVADYLGEVSTEIGSCWANGEFGVFDEHVASARLRQALSGIASDFHVPFDAPFCPLATLAGEMHTLSLSLLQLCLRASQIDALPIGADIPVRDLLHYLEDADPVPSMLGISASGWSNDPVSLADAYYDIASVCENKGIELFIGGDGAWPDDINYGYRCNSFRDLESVLKSLRSSGK